LKRSHCVQQPASNRDTVPSPMVSRTSSVLIGDRDNLLPDGDRKWAQDHLDDIRLINTDHFIIFLHPEVVAQLVLEAIGRTLDVPDRG
jgi:hypothetical protein